MNTFIDVDMNNGKEFIIYKSYYISRMEISGVEMAEKNTQEIFSVSSQNLEEYFPDVSVDELNINEYFNLSCEYILQNVEGVTSTENAIVESTFRKTRG